MRPRVSSVSGRCRVTKSPAPSASSRLAAPLDARLAKTLVGDERVVGDDPHAEPERPPGDLLPDPAEAEHARASCRPARPRSSATAPSGPASAPRAPAGCCGRGRRSARSSARRRRRPSTRARSRPRSRAGRGRDVDVVDAHARPGRSPSGGPPARSARRQAASPSGSRSRRSGRSPRRGRSRGRRRRRSARGGARCRPRRSARGRGRGAAGRSVVPGRRSAAGYPFPPPAGTAANASSARVTAVPRSMSAPEVGERELDRAERGRDVEDVVISRCGRSGRSSPSGRPARRRSSRRSDRGARGRARRSRSPSATRIAVTTAERSSSGEKSSSPIAFAPSRQARPRRHVPLERVLQPLLEQQPERDVERADERDRRGERAVELLPGPHASSPSRGRSAASCRAPPRRRGETETSPRPGRGHQRLLRAGGDDVEAPGVGLERDGAEAGDAVDDGQRPGRLRGRGERLHVGDDARRRLGMGHEHGLRAAELGKPGGEVVGARRLAPLVGDRLDRRSRTLRRASASARRSGPPRRRRRGRPASRGWRRRTPSPPCPSR